MEISKEAEGIHFIPIEQKPIGYTFIAKIEKLAPGIVYDPNNNNEPKEIDNCVYFTELTENGEMIHTYYGATVLYNDIKDGIESGAYEIGKTTLKIKLVDRPLNHAGTRHYAKFHIFKGRK